MKQGPNSFSIPENPQIVIVGGGFAGLELMKRLANKPCQVLLLDKHNYHTFQPLLYQVASGSLSPDSIGFPFRRRTSRHTNIHFRKAEVTEIHPSQKKVSTNVGVFTYDLLVVSTGSRTNFFGNTALAKHAMQLKEIPHALDIRSEFLQEFEKAALLKGNLDADHALNFVVVGGGPTGVEVSGALAEIKKHILMRDYPEVNPNLMNIFLVQADPQLLTGFSPKSSAKAKSYLESMGVNVMLNTQVKSYDGKKMVYNDENELFTDTLIWAAGVTGNKINGLPDKAFERNRILVNAFCQLQDYPEIFALGDCAMMKSNDHPNGHPMVAPPAIQQAECLAKNILNPMTKWKPFRYKDQGAMATIGRKKAVVDVGRIHLSGSLAWWVWMAVHLLSLVSSRNRILVFFNWAMKYFSYKNTIRLIIRPHNRANASGE